MLKLTRKTLLIKDLLYQKSNHFDNLVMYSLNTDPKYLMDIKNFFNTLSEAGLILDNQILKIIGEKFLELLALYEGRLLNKRDLMLEIAKLFGKAYIEIDRLDRDQNHMEGHKGEEAGSRAIGDKNHNKKGRKILIVDDDIMVLNMLKDIFTSEGYRVILNSNPLGVIGTIREEKIDLVILDIIMPQINGIDLIKQIKKVDCKLPIFMLSLKDDSKSKVEALRLGADDYITKPFQRKELIARVDRAIERSLKFKEEIIIDWLTGTYNKYYFWRKAREYKNYFNKSKSEFSLAFIDLDNFKSINDIYGHLLGDRVLKVFAKQLKQTLRNIDQVFRFGGDEFVVIFPNTGVRVAYGIMEELRRDMDKINIELDNSPPSKVPYISNNIISFSAGITQIYGIEDELEDMVERADKALYAAKRDGRNKIYLYEELSPIQ